MLQKMKERFAAWFVAYFGIGEYIIYRAEQSIEGLIPTGKMAEIEGRLSQLIDEIEELKEPTRAGAIQARRSTVRRIHPPNQSARSKTRNESEVPDDD